MWPLLILGGAAVFMLYERSTGRSLLSGVSLGGTTALGSSGAHYMARYPDGSPMPAATGPIGFPEPPRIAPAAAPPSGAGQMAGAAIGAGTAVVGGSLALAGVGSATGASLGAGLGAAAAVPIIGGIAAGAVALSYVVYKAFNHPFGTCSPGAKDSTAYLNCWNHPIPAAYIPVWLGGSQGWGWAWCDGPIRPKGAPNGKAWLDANIEFLKGPGCASQCNCGNVCKCAPPGAVIGLKDGTFVRSDGSNAGTWQPSTVGVCYPPAPTQNQPNKLIPYPIPPGCLPAAYGAPRTAVSDILARLGI